MFYLISSVDVKKRIQLSELIKVMVRKEREGGRSICNCLVVVGLALLAVFPNNDQLH